MMTEEDCDLLIKNNEKIRKLLEKGNANKYLTFKEINGAIDNMDTDVMDILFQLLAARKIVIVEDKREFESLSKNQNKKNRKNINKAKNSYKGFFHNSGLAYKTEKATPIKKPIKAPQTTSTGLCP